jgi:hypothetical protein
MTRWKALAKALSVRAWVALASHAFFITYLIFGVATGWAPFWTTWAVSALWFVITCASLVLAEVANRRPQNQPITVNVPLAGWQIASLTPPESVLRLNVPADVNDGVPATIIAWRLPDG